jgi:dihydrofolate reductase
MRKVVVNEFLSLDGVAQAPGLQDEDTSGGFPHGGWHIPFMDEVAGEWVRSLIISAGGLVLGRRTYQIFASYWPNAPEAEQAFARPMNSLPKHVASRILREPLDWQNSSLLHGDPTTDVRSLKQADGGDLLVIGSTTLVKALIEEDLVDEFRLMIDPLVLGGGKRIFGDDGKLRSYHLVDSRSTGTGAILATYAADRPGT